MRVFYLLMFFLVCTITVVCQERSIGANEYSSAFDFAVSETNSRFPFIHTFTSEIYENGKLISSSVHVAERQSMSKERQTFRNMENGKEILSYQLRTAAGPNVFCSSDGNVWFGPQPYECPRSIRLYRPPTPTSVEYWTQDKKDSEEKLKVYRKFEVYGDGGQDSTYDEEITIINMDGLFVSTTRASGKLNPRSVSTKLTNSWEINAKFPAITVPKNVRAPQNDIKKKTTLILNKN